MDEGLDGALTRSSLPGRGDKLHTRVTVFAMVYGYTEDSGLQDFVLVGQERFFDLASDLRYGVGRYLVQGRNKSGTLMGSFVAENGIRGPLHARRF